MPSRQETRFREHLSLLRQAAGGLGRDMENEITQMERKIEQGAKRMGWESQDLAREMEYDFAVMGVRIQKGLRSLPTQVKKGGQALGSAVARGSAAVGSKTADASVRLGKATKKGVKKELARAAGTWHEPLRQWSPDGDRED